MNQTVYTFTKHCRSAAEVVETLKNIGLGRGALANECKKIAAADGPRAKIYRDAVMIVSRDRNKCFGVQS